MSFVTAHQSVSLDGYSAGPDQGPDQPLGRGGELLHRWFFGPPDPVAADAEIARSFIEPNGAYVMGRGMFGGGRGPWDPEWHGWWGDDPPYHAPVFVLTHHAREPLEMAGGTTFHFVTSGFDDALAQALRAAGDREVSIAGGASVVQQALRAGAVDELHVHVAPILLGSGTRLLEDVGDPTLEPLDAPASPHVAHLRYRIVRP